MIALCQGLELRLRPQVRAHAFSSNVRQAQQGRQCNHLHRQVDGSNLHVVAALCIEVGDIRSSNIGFFVDDRMTGKDNCEATAEQLLPTTRVHSSLPELTSDGENYSWTVTVGALHGSGLWSTPTAYSQPRFRLSPSRCVLCPWQQLRPRTQQAATRWHVILARLLPSLVKPCIVVPARGTTTPHERPCRRPPSWSTDLPPQHAVAVPAASPPLLLCVCYVSCCQSPLALHTRSRHTQVRCTRHPEWEATCVAGSSPGLKTREKPRKRSKKCSFC